jgi:hypothetical protein
MRLQLIRFLKWCLAKLEPQPDHSSLYARTKELVRWADSFAAGTSGEYKRHQVYARLMKEFPELPKRSLGLAIELALQD